MNLLSYTKKLSEQIRYYDIITKNNFLNPNVINPFKRTMTEAVNLTIIWVDSDDSDKF